jgi:hypothetical protein
VQNHRVWRLGSPAPRGDLAALAVAVHTHGAQLGARDDPVLVEGEPDERRAEAVEHGRERCQEQTNDALLRPQPPTAAPLSVSARRIPRADTDSGQRSAGQRVS